MSIDAVAYLLVTIFLTEIRLSVCGKLCYIDENTFAIIITLEVTD